MNQKERTEYMSKADNLKELLKYACDVQEQEAGELVSKVNNIENFLENKGFSHGKPRKMSILYVMGRYGHTPRTVEKWWGKTESSYDSFSNSLGKKYLKQIKELINKEAEFDESDSWTPGDKVYDSTEDPLTEYFDIDKQGRNADITSF